MNYILPLPGPRDDAIEHLRSSTPLKHIKWFDEIDSTNQQARRMILSGDHRLPMLLVADRQTAGRGRSDRVWWSPDGCLMFSLVIGTDQLPADPAKWPQLSLVAGIATAQAAESLIMSKPFHSNPLRIGESTSTSKARSIELKWPNDLYSSGRKLAGILVEAMPLSSPAESTAVSTNHDCTTAVPRMAFVIGIGLNVAVDFSQAPDEVRQRACSLSEPPQHHLVRPTPPALSLHVEDALVPIIEQIFEELAAWQAGSERWWHAWNDRNLLAGRTVHLRLPGAAELVGLCEGIDPAGRLLVRDTHRVHPIQSADVVGWN